MCLHTDSYDVEQQLRVSGKSSKLTRFGSSSSRHQQWQHLLRNKSQTVQRDMSNALMPAPQQPGKKCQSVCTVCVCVCIVCIDRLTKAPLKGFILIESERGSLQLPVNFDMM